MVKRIFISFLFLITIYELQFTNYNLFGQDKIIAIVNKDIITQKDLNDFLNFMRVQLSTEYRGKELESKIQSMKLDLLDKLIEDNLILQEAKKAGIRINPERIKAKINEIRKHYPSDNEFQMTLFKQGLVQADIEKKINEQMLMYSVIEKEIRGKIIIKPVEVTDFYQENIKQFVSIEQREFECVTVDNEGLAEEIYNKLKNGDDDLENVANNYSLGTNKLRFSKGGQLKKEVEEALFQMNAGQVSMPIKIDNNYYIFKLNSIIAPRQQTLPEVQDTIQAELFNSSMQKALAKWIDELKARSYIKIVQD